MILLPVTDAQRRADDPTLRFNTEAGIVELNKKDLEVDKNEGKDHTVTITFRWKRATYTKAVFSMAFSYAQDKIPSKNNNWYLDDNPW